MIYNLFRKKNIIIFVVVLLVLVLVNSFAVNSNDGEVELKYANTNNTTLTLHHVIDESMDKKPNDVTLVLKYDIRNVRSEGYSPNDVLIKINGLGNIRDDQMNIKIDPKVAVNKNNAHKDDAMFTYYYNKSTNQYIFINNKRIEDYMKGEIRITFHIDDRKIVKDYQNIVVASISTPNIKLGNNELIYEEKK